MSVRAAASRGSRVGAIYTARSSPGGGRAGNCRAGGEHSAERPPGRALGGMSADGRVGAIDRRTGTGAGEDTETQDELVSG